MKLFTHRHHFCHFTCLSVYTINFVTETLLIVLHTPIFKITINCTNFNTVQNKSTFFVLSSRSDDDDDLLLLENLHEQHHHDLSPLLCDYFLFLFFWLFNRSLSYFFYLVALSIIIGLIILLFDTLISQCKCEYTHRKIDILCEHFFYACVMCRFSIFVFFSIIVCVCVFDDVNT